MIKLLPLLSYHLVDQDGGFIRVFDQDEGFDLDIGPLDDLDGYKDPQTEWWDKQICPWEKVDDYGCFEFDRSDPYNVNVQCEFCAALCKTKGLCSWSTARGRATTTQMNNHLKTDAHKATMLDYTIPELREKKKKQSEVFK